MESSLTEEVEREVFEGNNSHFNEGSAPHQNGHLSSWARKRTNTKSNKHKQILQKRYQEILDSVEYVEENVLRGRGDSVQLTNQFDNSQATGTFINNQVAPDPILRY